MRFDYHKNRRFNKRSPYIFYLFPLHIIMAINYNDLCPGGTGKKIRDCGCGNLDDYQTVQKMLEGYQLAAALNYINAALDKNPNRPCMLIAKCDALFLKHLKETKDGKESPLDLWRQAVEDFYSKFPENPLALGWKSFACALENDVESSFDYLEKCFIHHYPEMNPSGMLNALETLAHLELTDNNFPSAIFLTQLRLTFLSQIESSYDYEPTLQRQMRLLSRNDVPLAFRQSYVLLQTNSRGAVNAEFTAALELVSTFHWLESAQAFEKIAASDPTEFNAAYNSAIMYLHRGKKADAVRMFKIYAERQPEPNHKANALSIALLLTDSPFQDNMPMSDIQYTVTDQDKMTEALISSPYIQYQQLPPNSNFDGPPPLFFGMLLDQPMPKTWSDDLTFEDIPIVTGMVVLWGKRTDREAILEFTNILDCDREHISELIKESFADCVTGEPMSVLVDQPSITIDSFNREQIYPNNTPAEKESQLRQEHLNDLLINCWSNLPLGVLGSSVRQAAADPEKRFMAYAVIITLKQLLGSASRLFDFDKLYSAINLPALPVLKVGSDDLPTLLPCLYDAVDLKSLPDKDLAFMYAQYNPYGIDSFMTKISKEIISRDNLSVNLRKTAYIKLCLASKENYQEYLQKGKDFCKVNNVSDSFFDILELNALPDTGAVIEVENKMQEIYKDHKDEPEAMQALMNFLQRMQQTAEAYSQLKSAGGQDAAAPSPILDSNSLQGLNPGPAPAEPEEKKSSIWLPD